MDTLIMILGMLLLGVFVGSRTAVRQRDFPWLGKVQSVALVLLIGALGVEIGADDRVISSLGDIGLAALAITILALAGSVLCVGLARRWLKLDRQGRSQNREGETP